MPRLAECHPERPHKARGLCGACYQRERYQNDPEHRAKVQEGNRLRSRERYANDPEFRAAHLERSRERKQSPEWKAYDAQRRQDPAWLEQDKERRRKRYAENPRSPEESRRAHLWTRYRLTIEGWAALVEAQEGCCYLCRDPLSENTRLIHVDHDHTCCPKRGQSCGECVRGLACEPCNTGIGAFNDDPERMRRVADNLEMAQLAEREFPSPERFAEIARQCFEPVGVGSNAPALASSEVAINPH